MKKIELLTTMLALSLTSISALPTEDTPLCEWCKAGIRENKIIMHDTCTLGELDLIQGWVCENVPIDNCDSYMTAVRGKLTDWIDSWDEDYWCKRMEWCLHDSDKPHTAITYPDPNPIAPEWCDYCHDVLGELKKVAHDPDVLIMNKDNPYIVCDIVDIPGCLVTMKLFFKWGLETCQNIDVTQQCVQWNVCKEGDQTTPEQSGSGGLCSVCENTVDLLIKELNDPAMEENIELAIDAVCRFLPFDHCQDTLMKYITFMKVLSGSLDGKTLCTASGAC
ncbi:hypothetical protein ACHWQZ_G007059 [Mnemiopsis leidyi]